MSYAYIIPHIPAFLHLQIGRGADYDLRSLYGEHKKKLQHYGGVRCNLPLVGGSRSSVGIGLLS